MSIRVEQISKTYGNQVAVDHLSFTLKPGELCGFLGANGAGKSTTLKLLTGYLAPDKGAIFIQGIDALKFPLQAKKEIGYLAEHNPLYQDLYVKEFLSFIANLHKIKYTKKAVFQVIVRTGLEKVAHKKIKHLSKGFQQRVGLAQALIHDPSILLLDEPLSGLDPTQLIELRKLIQELGETKTVLFSSHILQEVEKVAQRIIMIKDGVLQFDKTVQSLAAEHIVTKLEFDEELTPVQYQELSLLAEIKKIENIYFANGGSKELRKQLFQFAVTNGLTLLQLTEQKNDLTDIFIGNNK